MAAGPWEYVGNIPGGWIHGGTPPVGYTKRAGGSWGEMINGVEHEVEGYVRVGESQPSFWRRRISAAQMEKSAAETEARRNRQTDDPSWEAAKKEAERREFAELQKSQGIVDPKTGVRAGETPPQFDPSIDPSAEVAAQAAQRIVDRERAAELARQRTAAAAGSAEWYPTTSAKPVTNQPVSTDEMATAWWAPPPPPPVSTWEDDATINSLANFVKLSSDAGNWNAFQIPDSTSQAGANWETGGVNDPGEAAAAIARQVIASNAGDWGHSGDQEVVPPTIVPPTIVPPPTTEWPHSGTMDYGPNWSHSGTQEVPVVPPPAVPPPTPDPNRWRHSGTQEVPVVPPPSVAPPPPPPPTGGQVGPTPQYPDNDVPIIGMDPDREYIRPQLPGAPDQYIPPPSVTPGATPGVTPGATPGVTPGVSGTGWTGMTRELVDSGFYPDMSVHEALQGAGMYAGNPFLKAVQTELGRSLSPFKLAQSVGRIRGETPPTYGEFLQGRLGGERGLGAYGTPEVFDNIMNTPSGAWELLASQLENNPRVSFDIAAHAAGLGAPGFLRNELYNQQARMQNEFQSQFSQGQIPDTLGADYFNYLRRNIGAA